MSKLDDQLAEAKWIAEALYNLDWCIGYDLTPDQYVTLDLIRDRAIEYLNKYEEKPKE